MYKRLRHRVILLLLPFFSTWAMEYNPAQNGSEEQTIISVATRVALWFANPSKACTHEIEYLKKSGEPTAHDVIEETKQNPAKTIVLHSVPYDLVNTFCSAHLQEMVGLNCKHKKECKLLCPAMVIFDNKRITGQYQQIIGSRSRCLYHNFLEPQETVKDDRGWHFKERIKEAEETYDLFERLAPEVLTSKAVLKYSDTRYELKETEPVFFITDKSLKATYIIFKKSKCTVGN